MKRCSWFFRVLSLLLVLLLAGCTGAEQSAPVPQEGEQRLLVLASFYTMADFAGKVAGERAEVINLLPAGGDPHDWEPSAKDMAKLEQADLLVINGTGFEHWVQDVVPTLANQALTVVDTTAPLALPEAQSGQEQDPHVWLSPVWASAQLGVIRDALVQADPQGSAEYNANCEAAQVAFAALDSEYRTALAALPKKEIVVAHAAFGYLCEEYGLTQLAVSGLSPEGEPDPAQMADVIRYATDHQVRVIFFERAASAKVAETIAREIGATTAVLDPLENLDPAEQAAGGDYCTVMRENLQQLKAALA